MNGIEKITSRILDDAKNEAQEVLDRATEEAQEVLAQFQAQADREYEELTRRGAERANEREKNLEGASLLEVRKQTLAAKQDTLDRAFTMAAEKLSALTGDDYIALLATLAAKSTYGGNEQIILSPEDAKEYGKAVIKKANALLKEQGKEANLTLSSETRPTGGGLILNDGNIETNCTFETLLRLTRNNVASEVANTLFG